METQTQWKSGANYGASPERAASVARERFEKQLHEGRASAEATIAHVVNNVPDDAIVASKDLSFEANGNGLKVWLSDASGPCPVHKHAFNQIASRAGIPTKFANELVGADEDWKRELIAHNLNEMYHREPKRYLARSVGGELRGWLSDRYARYDSRPVLDTFIAGLQTIGAVPLNGTATDTRWSIKAALPQVFEPVPGEVLVYGLELLNSDFGNGALHVRAFIDRLWCWNLCSGEDAIKKTHLGAKLGDDIRYSQKTYQLQTETQASAVGDVVKHMLSEDACEQMNATIRKAADNEVTWDQVKGRLKTLHKGEQEKVKDLFEGQDTYNLPEGKSVWRASNAVSWLATSLEDGERKLDLERVAGQLVSA
jgi:hypothetical protein